DTLAFLLLLSLLLPSLLIMFIPSTFKRPVSSWKALNLRKTLLMASSVRLKPLNCSRLPCVYAQETLTFLSNRYKLITNVRSSLMAVNIHITIIELNALHTKRQNLFQELDAVIHLLMEAKHRGLRKSRNATSFNSRFKSLDTLKVKIISVTFRSVIRTKHKKASKIWRHENIQLGGCQSGRLFPRQITANTISFTVFPEIVPSIGNSFINTMKNIIHTRSSITDDIRNILCSSANMRRAIPLI